MRFLSPGFLFALLTIAIPVIIHLFNFRKFKKIYFSNVRFLKDVQLQTSSRQHLRERLILASRILAITLLVFAFARPYIPDSDAQNSGQRQVLSIYIDNSMSMELRNREGTLLEEAKRRAKELASAYGLNDRFQLLTNDFEGKYHRLLSFDEFLEAVDEVILSRAHKDLAQILGRQKEIFLKEPNSVKTVYLISDFQHNMLPQAAVAADSTYKLRLVRLKATEQTNSSVDSVWFQSAIHRPGDSEKLIVRLRNYSDEQAEAIPIKLSINGKQKALGTVSIPPGQQAVDTLIFSGLKSGWQQAEIEIKDFPVVFDDKFYFSFQVQESMPVLIINGDSENQYLNAVYGSDPFFRIENVAAGNINYSALNSYSLIILNELKEISDGLAQQLKIHISRGANMIVYPYLGNDQAELRKFLQVLGTDLPMQVISEEAKVTAINLQHPVFKGVFDQIPQKMDLPVAKKYVRFSSQSRLSSQKLMELQGGIPFFSEYRLGSGKIYLSAVPLNAETSNFARHSVFVPIMYQTALLSVRNQNLFHQLNSEQMIELPKITLKSNQTLKLKNAGFEAIPDLRQHENYSQLYIADQIKQSGNYQLHKADSLLAVLSFNDSGSESDMSFAENQEIKDKFSGRKIDLIEPDSGSIKNEIKTINQGLSLWKVCLILALLFFAFEILLIRFYNRTQIKPLHN